MEIPSPISPISALWEGATGRRGAGIEARQCGTSLPGGDQGGKSARRSTDFVKFHKVSNFAINH